jgi:hypothetical protein
VSPVDRVLDALRAHGGNPKRNGANWQAKCPAHDDRVASLSISEGNDGRVLLHCHAGCDTEAIVIALNLEMRDLFVEDKKPPSGRETRYPYPDEHGQLLYTQVRVDFADGTKKVWTEPKGVKQRTLYRLGEVLNREPADRWVLLPEGEKCVDRLVAEGFVATTNSHGAKGWRDELARHLAGARVALLADNDDEGRKRVEAAARSLHGVAGIVRVVDLPDLPTKGDVVDWLNNGGTAEELGQRIIEAPDWPPDIHDRLNIGENGASTPSATTATVPPPPVEPPELARNPQILNVFREAIGKRGVVGEETTACTLYLILTSRVLDKQVSAAVKGHTSSGKSWTVERVVEFYPPDAVIEMTAMSEHALVYMKEDFQHRTLVLYEAVALREGQEENHTAYFVRSLLSEGRIRYPVAMRDKDEGMVTRWIVKDGPTNLIVTTTKTEVHAENETRLLSFSTDDSREQTARIMAELAAEADDDTDLSEWRQLQAWLAGANHKVTIPYSKQLAKLVPPVAIRLRRDFGALLALIRAHAVLHQLSRDTDDKGRIVATVDDYRAVRGLVADVLAEGVGSTVSETIRETVKAVEKLAPRHKDGVPAAAVAEILKLDKSAARRRLLQANDRDYVHNEEDRKGRPGRWVIGEPLPESVELLPDPDKLAVPPHHPTTPPPTAETVTPQGNPAGGGTVAGGQEGVEGDATEDDLGAHDGWKPPDVGALAEAAAPLDGALSAYNAKLRKAEQTADEPLDLEQLTIDGKPAAAVPKHPAVFSDELMPVLAAAVPPAEYPRVLDPFAGIGRIHQLANHTVAVELEPEWARAHPGTIVANALALPFTDEAFDAIVTSPTYGNRFADHHVARDGSVRRSYTHDLGRKLHPNNSGQLHWGAQYRTFHARAWASAVRVLRPGGRFVLNVSDHIRNHERQPVTDWHVETLTKLGFREIGRTDIPTKRMRYGENADARVDAEHVITFEKPAATSVGDGLDDLRSLLRDDPKRFTR